MPRLSRAVAPLAVCALFGCSEVNDTPKSTLGDGQVHLSTQFAVEGNSAGDPLLCAQVTLTPYSIDSSSGALGAQAGAPVTFNTQEGNASNGGGPNAGNSTDQILGCIAGTPYTGGSNGSYNWAYVVSATDFAPCDSSDPLPNDESISPAVVSETVYVDCTAGLDVPLNINIPVSIAIPDSAGYVDISAVVSGTNVGVGCKMADANPDGIHFGDISFYTPANPDNNAPLGLTGIGLLDGDGIQTATAPQASYVQQWAGIITDNTTAQNAAYYTGILNPPAPSVGQTGIWDIVQTFAQVCPAGGAYVATQVPECDTTVDTAQETDGTIDTAAVSTATLLADLVETFPDPNTNGQLDWLSARILPSGSGSAPTQLALTSGIAQGTDPSNSSAQVGSFLSDPYQDPTTLPVWNAEALNQVLDVNSPSVGSSGPYLIDGLYPDPDSSDPAGQLILIVSDATGAQEYATVSLYTGDWAINALQPLTSYAELSLLGSVQTGCQAIRGE